MPGKDGTGPMGNGSVGKRSGSGNGRGRGGCRNDNRKNNRFANNRTNDPYCWKWDNSSPNDVSVLKNQAEYYEKKLETIKQQISNLEVEPQITEN